MKVFYDKTLTGGSNYVSEIISSPDCVELCLKDENCDAFEYTHETQKCKLFLLQDTVTMGYSFTGTHIGSVHFTSKLFETFLCLSIWYRADAGRSSVFWTVAAGLRKSWHGKIMPNPNEINTIGSGQADELTKLDEIRQLDHQGQCCEYISVRFSDKSLQPYIFAKKQEIVSHAEYFNIGKIVAWCCLHLLMQKLLWKTLEHMMVHLLQYVTYM